jgi:tRNA pseudouridine55 synthase
VDAAARPACDGVLVVDKPAGPTSHDIVAMARRAVGTRAIGHTGTLDPAATGVLALVIGRATRLASYLGGDKCYDAVIRFGRSTDTYDATGTVVADSVERPSPAALAAALAGFRGPFDQAPPPYSAKKIGGVAAYDLARRDRAVRPAPVRVTVHALELTAFDRETARLRLTVSAGFYVRSLAHDLGAALGTGAVLEALRRTAAGPFPIEDAVPASRLSAEHRSWLADRIRPIDALLPELPAVTLSEREAAMVRHGRDLPRPAPPALARLVDAAGHLVAIATPATRPGFLHPAVVLG